MNIKKSWLMTFALSGLFAFSSFAGAPIAENPTSVTKEFQKLLKGIELDDLENDLTVYVDFMINDKGEIMVLSTSKEDLDETIKERLNYKTIETGDLKYSTKYTLPVSFKK